VAGVIAPRYLGNELESTLKDSQGHKIGLFGQENTIHIPRQVECVV
jgi:hypothetical protein